MLCVKELPSKAFVGFIVVSDLQLDNTMCTERLTTDSCHEVTQVLSTEGEIHRLQS